MCDNQPATLMIVQMPAGAQNERLTNTRLADANDDGRVAVDLRAHNGLLVFVLKPSTRLLDQLAITFLPDAQFEQPMNERLAGLWAEGWSFVAMESHNGFLVCLVERPRRAGGYSPMSEDARIEAARQATTRDLLTELSFRMRKTQNSTAGRDLARLCDDAIENLASGVLDYAPTAAHSGRELADQLAARFRSILDLLMDDNSQAQRPIGPSIRAIAESALAEYEARKDARRV